MHRQRQRKLAAESMIIQGRKREVESPNNKPEVTDAQACAGEHTREAEEKKGTRKDRNDTNRLAVTLPIRGTFFHHELAK